jgi:hypothetical protein
MYRHSGSLGLSLLHYFFYCDCSLILVQRRRMALDIEVQILELGNQLFIVHLDAVDLEILGDLMNALLRHYTLLPAALKHNAA